MPHRIEMLQLSARANNYLKAESIYHIEDLALLLEQDLLKTPNMGIKSISIIKNTLDSIGMSFGMTPTEVRILKQLN